MGKIIVLDPGHGGTDSGACAFGVQEKVVNLAVALNAKEALKACGHSVLLTRASDVDMSLRDRGCYSVNHGADVFLSIHHDAADNNPAMEGCHGFYDNEGAVNGKDLATKVAVAVAETLLISNSYGGPASDWFGKHLGVLNGCSNWIRADAALVECCFLTNPDESALVESAGYAARVGAAIANGVQRHLGLAGYIPPVVPGDDNGQDHGPEEVSSWAQGAAEWMKANGLSDCTRPKEALTREEAWCYLQRLAEWMKAQG